MRVTRLVLVLCLIAVAVPLAARDVPTISSISPSEVHRYSGEWFVRIQGTGFLPLSGVVVDFSGPAGSITLQPNAGNDSRIDVWVPDRVMTTAGSYTVTVKATDANGTVMSNSVPFRVIGPWIRITYDPLVLAEALSRAGAYARFDVTATSALGGETTLDCSHKSGELYPFGQTSVDCYAKDEYGASAKARFTVEVADTTPPVFKAPEELMVFGESDGAKVFYEVSAIDVVDGEMKAICLPESGSVFPIGTSTVDCTSNDLSENVAKTGFRVHVGDEARPVLILPPSVEAEMESREGSYVSFRVSAVDIKGNPVGVECSHKSGGLFPPGPSTVKCAAGRSLGSFTVHVLDTTAPKLDIPRDFVAKAEGPQGAKVTYGAAGYDLIDGEIRVTCAPASGSLFGPGTTTVNCSGTDSQKNVARGSFTVEVPPYSDPSDYLESDDGTIGIEGPPPNDP